MMITVRKIKDPQFLEFTNLITYSNQNIDPTESSPNSANHCYK